MVRIDWTDGRWFPQYAKGGAMGVVGGVPVHAAGMTQPWRESELAWWYDVERGDWFPLDPMPVGRCYTSGCTVGEAFVVVGGRRAGRGGPLALADAWLLSRDGDRWRWDRLPDLHQGRAKGTVAATDDTVVAVGGGEWETKKGGTFTAGNVTTVEVLRLSDLDSGWVTAADPPFTQRSGCVATAVAGDVWVFGGYDCVVAPDGEREFFYYDDVYRYDIDADSWHAEPSLPVELYGGAAVTVDDRHVALMGGVVRHRIGGDMVMYHRVTSEERVGIVGEYSDLVWLYDTATGATELAADRMPHGLNDNAACIVGDTIYSVGGENVDRSTSNTSDAVMIGNVRVEA